jgi:NAD(P)-dependent dehydrogenase (short-subunit alcohol dehydrogenase family)
MRFSLRHRVAVLTGAASGIGAALAEQLAQTGADLALVDLNRASLEAVAEQARKIGSRVVT